MKDWKFWFLVVCSSISLLGCATPPSTSNAGKDMVTSSDEGDRRKRARLRLELATGYYERGQPTTALDEVKQSLAADPNFADAYNLRGLVYLRLNQPKLAEESFRKALDLDPKNADTLNNYGWFLCLEKRVPEAIAQFKAAEAVPAYSGAARTWLAHGVCVLQQQGDLKQAQSLLYHSFELDPSNPATATNLALVHFRLGDLDRARFYARKVNNSEDANAESLWLGMRIEKAAGNMLAVNELATQLHRRFPDSRQLRLYERGEWDEQ